MKQLAILLITLLTLSACQKVDVYDDEAESASAPNLTVSIFQLEQTPFSAITRATPAEACTRLSFIIYNSGGTRVKYINQMVGDASFGTATFQLEEGTYSLVVVAHSSTGNPTTTDATKIQFSNSIGFSDTFLHTESVTIGEEPVELSLSLDRIVSLCRFVITDDYPEDVAKMRFYYTGGSGAFNAHTGYGSVNSKQSVIFEVTENTKQFDLYTFLHADEGTIHLTVTAMDGGDNILKEREFDVPMVRNNITWLTGDYFTGSNAGTTTMTININTDWAGEKHLDF